jgi:hypothetical protein
MAFPPHVLPPSVSLSGAMPPGAPPGAILVMGDQGGWAVPPRKFTLQFGRDEDEVHVPIAVDDPYVSRQQGVFGCDGHVWWLENRGRLPIQIPRHPMLLRGHACLMASGYTPLIIISQGNRTHLLHVRVVGGTCEASDRRPGTRTKEAELYHLSKTEHMALAALAQRYLRGEPNPQPATWKQTADMLNLVPGPKEWNPRTVEHLVTAVRERLAIPFTSREEVGEPVGNTLNHNLIEALLRSACLLPEDLAFFE